ncbi:MAG TPA: hypothetical protein PLZ51_06800 [Aggregatilineales bacterium]|nr:hypothetical protein [Aggregatilineales bacterium]
MKNKNVLLKKLGYYILILITLFSMMCVALAYLPVLWLAGGQFIPQPNDTILLTAEYLYHNPLPTPNGVYISTEPHPYENTICISENYDNEPPLISSAWAKFYLNGALLPKIDNTQVRLFYNTFLAICLTSKYVEQLTEGSHLFEIEFYDLIFYRGTYQWVVKIEKTPTSTPTSQRP